jgi:hypothetical protein
MYLIAACARFMRARGLFLAFFCLQASAQTAPTPVTPAVPAMDGIATTLPPGNWQVVGIPGGKIAPTQFDAVTLDGNTVLRAKSDKAYANLTYTFKPGPLATTAPTSPNMLRWRWRLDVPVANADLRRKEGDDAAIKVCAFFDRQLDELPFWERTLLRIARASTGQYLPSATLCYVWDPKLAVGTDLPNAYTQQVRYLVLDAANSPLKQWVAHTQDLQADYVRSYRTKTSAVPPLLGIGIGADSDNTGGSSLAYVDDLSLMEQ